MEALIFGGLRTPRGKASPKGGLHPLTPIELVSGLCGALPDAVAGFQPEAVEDLVLGCATQAGEQGSNIARTAALVAGWGAPGATVNRFCASGIDAVNVAGARVKAGDVALVVAGGVESVSRVPMFADGGPLYGDPALAAKVGSVHMGIAGDLVATRERFTREALDGYSLRTRERARRAWKDGTASRSVAPVRVGEKTFSHDELVAFAPTAEELAALPPAFAEVGASGQDALALERYPELGALQHLHTKATSPPMADAAALLVLGSPAAAERHRIRPRARIVASATCSVEPVLMLTAGQLAVERVLASAGLRPDDVAIFEFAEAFSALCLKFQRDLAVGDDRFNVQGGTMALGHAFGATGAILVLNVVDLLEARGARYGVAAVSGAAGLGVATLIERLG